MRATMVQLVSEGICGEGGIRTHEHLAMLLDFQSSAFDRSATSPIDCFGYPGSLARPIDSQRQG